MSAAKDIKGQEAIKVDKGKSKRVEDSESDDQDFEISEQELYTSESESSYSDDESQDNPADEIGELFEEAEENGDKGDLVVGLRSGNQKKRPQLDQHQKAGSSSKKTKN